MTERSWPANWAERMAGGDCPICASLGKGDSSYWLHVATGPVTEVHLERHSKIPGYCIVVWKGRHVAEPAELAPGEAAQYWEEVVATGRAVASCFQPMKLNYFTLGNTVPHLHTHVVPRYRHDPAPGGPISWDEVVAPTAMAEDELRRVATALRGELRLPPEITRPAGGAPAPPPVTFVARFEIDLGPPVEVGTALLGQRRVIPIVGGRFAGPRLNGTVEPGGADWQRVATDGTAVIDTRYLLRTDDGVSIVIATEGFRTGPAEVLGRLRRGEPVNPDEYYFRVRITFDTGDDRYAWLRNQLFVASAIRGTDKVVFDAFLVA